MALRPQDGARWARALAHRSQKTPLDLGVPWMSWAAIEFLRRHIRPGARVFEWGGGGSTRFFVRRGCEVVTTESSAEWKHLIERAIERDESRQLVRSRPTGAHASIRHIPAHEEDPRSVAAYIGAIHDGAPWDVVIVDGLEESFLGRMDCMRQVPGLVRPGGIVVLDDAWRPAYREAPQVLEGWRRLKLRSLGPARMGVTQTDIYFCPGHKQPEQTAQPAVGR